MNQQIEKLIKTVNFASKPFAAMPYAPYLSFVLVILSLVPYNQFPAPLQNFYKSNAVKLILAFSGTLLYTSNSVLAVAVAIAAAIVAHFAAMFAEKFELISPTTDVLPGCANVTIPDLVALFNNDPEALKKALYVCNVPLNIHLTDGNAPLLATYLINAGKKVSDSCRLPETANATY